MFWVCNLKTLWIPALKVTLGLSSQIQSHKLCKHKCIELCVWHRHLYTHWTTTLHHTHVKRVSIQTWLKHRVSREQHFTKKKKFQSHSMAKQQLHTHTRAANANSTCIVRNHTLSKQQRIETRSRSDTIGGSQSVYMQWDYAHSWIMTFSVFVWAIESTLLWHVNIIQTLKGFLIMYKQVFF